MTNIPISPNWDDIRSYEQLKAQSLFSVRMPGRRAGVAIVLRQTTEGLEGVTVGHDRYGITIDAEFFATDKGILGHSAGHDGYYITRDVDRAVLDFLAAAGAF
jgi:hypothetical protein